MFPDFANPMICGLLMSVAFSVGTCITLAEKLSILGDYGGRGWHTWEVFRLDRTTRTVFRYFPQLANRLFDIKGVALITSTGLAGAAIMVFYRPKSVPFFVCILLAYSTTFLLNVRDVYGGDGSQQMYTLVGAALVVGFNPWTSLSVTEIALAFVAAQACLAYCTSGIAKVVSPIWRSGDALVSIIATKSYGSEFGLRIMSQAPRLSRLVCRITVVLEVLFPLALFGPKWVLIAALSWGLLFHVVNAFVMGLNTFLWAFLSTYPALIYCWIQLHPAGGHH